MPQRRMRISRGRIAAGGFQPAGSFCKRHGSALLLSTLRNGFIPFDFPSPRSESPWLTAARQRTIIKVFIGLHLIILRP